jgi:allantoin racemase
MRTQPPTVQIANIVPPGLTGYGPPPGLLSPDVVVEDVEMAFELHPATAVEMLLVDAAALDAAIRAERRGFDAVFINSTSDYGLRPARAALSIPIVGAGQASMLLACQLGHRFGLVSIWPESTRALHEVQLREYQLVDRCATMRFVTAEEEMGDLDQESNFYTQTQSGASVIIERVLGEIGTAIDEGCDAIVLGCTCMHPIAAELADRADVPVINPLTAGYIATQAAVRLSLRQAPAVNTRPSARHDEAVSAAVSAAADVLAASPHPGESCGTYCSIGHDLAHERAAGRP